MNATLWWLDFDYGIFPLTSGSRKVELSSSRMVEPASRRGTGCLESQWPVASSQADPQMQLRLLRENELSVFSKTHIYDKHHLSEAGAG